MGKLCQTFHLPYSLHKTPYCFTLPLSQCVLQSNFRKHLLFSGSSSPQLLYTNNNGIISLLLISQLFHHVEPSFGFRWKFCYSSPSHLMGENFVSWSAFCLSFVFVFWPIETIAANLQGVTHSSSKT